MNVQRIVSVVCIGFIFALAGCDNNSQEITAKKMIKENTANPFAPNAQNGQSDSKTGSSVESGKQEITTKKMTEENTANPFAPNAQNGQSDPKPVPGVESGKQGK